MSIATNHKRTLGSKGEDFAVQYLVRCLGWSVIERNWRCVVGEIDIVAAHENTVVIVEVRTRHISGRYGTAVESIDVRKLQRLRRLAAIYWQEQLEHKIFSSRMRVDVIGLSVESGTVVSMTHVQDVLA